MTGRKEFLRKYTAENWRNCEALALYWGKSSFNPDLDTEYSERFCAVPIKRYKLKGKFQPRTDHEGPEEE